MAVISMINHCYLNLFENEKERALRLSALHIAQDWRCSCPKRSCSLPTLRRNACTWQASDCKCHRLSCERGSHLKVYRRIFCSSRPQSEGKVGLSWCWESVKECPEDNRSGRRVFRTASRSMLMFLPINSGRTGGALAKRLSPTASIM